MSLKDGFVSGGADGKKNGKLPSTRPKLTESKLSGGQHQQQQQAVPSNTTSAATDSTRSSHAVSNTVSAGGEVAKSVSLDLSCHTSDGRLPLEGLT